MLNQTERDILTLFLESDSINIKPSEITKQLDVSYPLDEIHKYTLELWISGALKRDSCGYQTTPEGCKALLTAMREEVEE